MCASRVGSLPAETRGGEAKDASGNEFHVDPTTYSCNC